MICDAYQEKMLRSKNGANGLSDMAGYAAR